MASSNIKHRISRIGIGTVQFGMPYGINNSRGQVPYPEILSILRTALERGVTYLDTARLYDEAEEVLGKALEQLGVFDDFVVCSKLDMPKGYDALDDDGVLAEAERSLNSSLETLRCETIPYHILHNGNDMKFRDGMLWEFLKKQKRAGKVAHIGLSATAFPEVAATALGDPDLELLQIPYNVYDTRWEKAGILDKADAKGCTLVGRSGYLQGLVLMDDQTLLTKLPRAVPYHAALSRLSEEIGIAVKELALRFALTEPRVTTTIVGVDSYDQFKENVDVFEKGPLDDDIFKLIRQTFLDVPENIVNPSTWTE